MSTWFGSGIIPVVSQQWRSFVLLALLIYLLTVRRLRYRRARRLEEKYSPAGRSSFRHLTTNDAQAILKDLTELEFPKFFGFSIIFALFKTYGLPSVSSLLVSTGQLADAKKASKRIADTGVVLLEFALNAPTSERATKAIARMNYIHAQYQRAGKISNEDLLYTLSLFALEPARWVGKYEWRELTKLELCACGTYWKSMGDTMGISFEGLSSAASGWEDGLHWLQEVKSWSEEYEDQRMIPAATNRQLADAEFGVICFNVPSRFLGACKKLLSVLLGNKLRGAMMYPEPSLLHYTTINGVLAVRRLFLRHFALPRPDFMRKQYIPLAANPKTKRFNSVEYLSFPWYVKPTMWRRWGPRSWVSRLAGRKLPGDDGNVYLSEGWIFPELGPSALKNKGIKEMDQDRARMLKDNRGGCPFR